MIPIGDDTPTSKTPFVTWSLIGANIVAYALSRGGGLESFREVIYSLGFTPDDFRPLTLVSSMFLHASLVHLAGNMLFLWVFGDNVEDAMGAVRYLAFYLGAGIAAGLCHFVFNSDPTLPTVGASGAISGILGAHIILFPRNRIRILFWWYFYIRIFKVQAGWALGFYFVMQVLLAVVFGEYSNVAYGAHIGGFAVGLAATLVLMSLGVVKPIRAAVRSGASGGKLVDEFDVDSGGSGRVQVYRDRAGGVNVLAAESTLVAAGQVSADSGARVRAILDWVSAGETDRAVQATQLELRLPGKRAADLPSLAKIADAFYQNGVYAMAFHVYDAFIARATPGNPLLPEVEFRAGIIASRDLRDFAAAKRLLADAAKRHESAERRAQAERELRRIEANLERTSIDSAGGLLEGPCAVIRQTAGMVNISEIGRIVSQAVKRPLADVTRLLKGSVGFVGTGLDPVQAKAVAAQLQEMGVPVLVVPEDKLVALPAARELTWAAVGQEGLTLRAGGGEAEPIEKKWDDVFYISAGRVAFTSQKRVVDDLGGSTMTRRYGGIGLGGMGAGVPMEPESKWRYVERKEVKIVCDIFTLNPFACLRGVDGKVDFRGSPQGATMSSHLNFMRLVSDIVAYGRGVPVNEGVKVVAANASERRWRSVTFNSIADFERYNYWRLQLEQYG